MALFGTKKTEKKVVKAEKVAKVAKPAISTARTISASAAQVIIRPHITEKTGMLSETGVYTFEVVKGVSSKQISDAIQALFKVVPVKVSVTNIRSKKRMLRGIPGKTATSKKAYIYLKKGVKIEFI